MNQQYTPYPIKTDNMTLSDEILKITEPMAKNVHEVWVFPRMVNGWQYGKERNDVLKLHPCLLPYKNLSEAEKEFDCTTAISTLKLIRKLGFEIKRKQ